MPPPRQIDHCQEKEPLAPLTAHQYACVCSPAARKLLVPVKKKKWGLSGPPRQRMFFCFRSTNEGKPPRSAKSASGQRVGGHRTERSAGTLQRGPESLISHSTDAHHPRFTSRVSPSRLCSWGAILESPGRDLDLDLDPQTTAPCCPWGVKAARKRDLEGGGVATKKRQCMTVRMVPCFCPPLPCCGARTDLNPHRARRAPASEGGGGRGRRRRGNPVET